MYGPRNNPWLAISSWIDGTLSIMGVNEMLWITLSLLALGYVTVFDLGQPWIGYVFLATATGTLVRGTEGYGSKYLAVLALLCLGPAFVLFREGWPVLSIHVLSLGVAPLAVHAIRRHQ
jgi:hypothetical protein